jgi:hypothetical protein
MKKKLNVRVGMCFKFFDETLVVTGIIGGYLIQVKKYIATFRDFDTRYLQVTDIQSGFIQLKEIEI